MKGLHSKVRSRVPQGSILGTTHSHFIMFINYLPLCFDLYADDITVHTKDNNINTIEHNLMCDFEMLLNNVKWSKPTNRLFHYGKITCPLAGTRQQLNMSRKLNIQVENKFTLVISKSKRISEILRHIRTSTYQICKIGEKINVDVI